VAFVFIPAQLQSLTGGRSPVEVEGANVRQLIDNLEESCPGIRDRLVLDGRLRTNISVAVDGEVSPMGLLEPVAPGSEVHFVAAISGGAGASAILLA
jgi:molybdopterin converting factor small subunit